MVQMRVAGYGLRVAGLGMIRVVVRFLPDPESRIPPL